MMVLHLLRSAPDEMTSNLIQEISGPKAEQVHLYSPDMDWDRLIGEIFDYEKVVSWW